MACNREHGVFEPVQLFGRNFFAVKRGENQASACSAKIHRYIVGGSFSFHDNDVYIKVVIVTGVGGESVRERVMSSCVDYFSRMKTFIGVPWKSHVSRILFSR